ncbi:MAG: hypothetical protein ACRYFZ_07110 [Janthinobacterium lividum]
MLKLLFPLAALAASMLAGCQSASAPATETPVAAASAPATTTNAPDAPTPVVTEAAARAAVARHIQSLPNAALFVPDSARVNDNEATWQVLVPRTDWVGRMPNRARFEVDKQTGQVSGAPVK